MKGRSSLEHQGTGARGSPGWPASLVQAAVCSRGDDSAWWWTLQTGAADPGFASPGARGVCAPEA